MADGIDLTDGTSLDYDGLRRAAAQAVQASGQTQAEIAQELGVHRSSVTRALNECGRSRCKMQRRIIALLTPYSIRRRVVFDINQKEE
jgi:DNA invertase Pin-like site-specific DNA recombinase